MRPADSGDLPCASGRHMCRTAAQRTCPSQFPGCADAGSQQRAGSVTVGGYEPAGAIAAPDLACCSPKGRLRGAARVRDVFPLRRPLEQVTFMSPVEKVISRSDFLSRAVLRPHAVAWTGRPRLQGYGHGGAATSMGTGLTRAPVRATLGAALGPRASARLGGAGCNPEAGLLGRLRAWLLEDTSEGHRGPCPGRRQTDG